MMKPNFFAGVLTGFIMATLAGGWFAASQNLFAPAASADTADKKDAGPERVYFATTPDGRVTPLEPLSEPAISPATLRVWVTQTLAEVLSFDDATRTESMRSASRHFTPEGWKEFTDMIDAVGWKSGTGKPRYIYTTTPSRGPTIHREGIRDGLYSWVVEVPLLTNIGTPANPQGNGGIGYKAIVVVSRALNRDDPSGVNITSFKMMSPTVVPAAGAAPAVPAAPAAQ